MQTWGVTRTRKYISKLGKAIDGLRNFPNIGRNRNEIFPGCKTIHEGVHTVIYHIEGSVVFVDRVLHSRMDIGKHVNLPE